MTVASTIPLFKPVLLPEMEGAALEVLRSGQIASGPAIARFEEKFENLVGARHAVSTSDMTAAVTLALHFSGVRPQDEVATLAFSCLSSNSPVAQLGAVPVWIDVDPATMGMSVKDLEQKITSRTKAVMMYHVAGYPGPAREVAELCKRRGLAFIEDCNNALGAEIAGSPVGIHGDFAIYSLYPNRQINGIEGGVLVCKSESAAQNARVLRRFGIDSRTFRDARGEINPASDVPVMGWSIALNQLNAVVAESQLPSLRERLQRTQTVGRRLQAAAAETRGLSVVDAPETRPAFWGCLLLSDQRDALLAHLKSRGILASVLHHRNDEYSAFGTGKSDLPGTEQVMTSLIALPSGWWLSDADTDFIAKELLNFRRS